MARDANSKHTRNLYSSIFYYILSAGPARYSGYRRLLAVITYPFSFIYHLAPDMSARRHRRRQLRGGRGRYLVLAYVRLIIKGPRPAW